MVHLFFSFFLSATWSHFFSSFPDQGTVQKVVVLPTNFSASGELILEELEVFQVWLAPSFPMCVFTQTLCSKRLWQGQLWLDKRSSKCAYCQLDTYPKRKINVTLMKAVVSLRFFFSPIFKLLIFYIVILTRRIWIFTRSCYSGCQKATFIIDITYWDCRYLQMESKIFVLLCLSDNLPDSELHSGSKLVFSLNSSSSKPHASGVKKATGLTQHKLKRNARTDILSA